MDNRGWVDNRGCIISLVQPYFICVPGEEPGPFMPVSKFFFNQENSPQCLSKNNQPHLFNPCAKKSARTKGYSPGT